MTSRREVEGITPEEAIGLDQQLCFALYTASRLMTRAYRPVLAPMGLTYPQYLVLLVLWEEARLHREPPSVRGLGVRLKLDSGTLTPLLKRMEAEGLVRRDRSVEDERVVQVALKPRGAALKARALEIPQQMLARADADADASRLLALRDELRWLMSALDAEGA